MNAELTTPERGAVVAGVLTLGADAPSALAKIGPHCVRAARQLLALPRDERASVLARCVARMHQPITSGLKWVHRDWIETPLAGETKTVRDAVAGMGVVSNAARRWLQRWAFAELVDMPTDGATGAAGLAHRPTSVLLSALALFGRDALAAVLVGAGRAQVAAVASMLGKPHGGAFVRDMARRRTGEVDVAHPPRPSPRQLAHYVRGFGAGATERDLVLVGIRRLAFAIAVVDGDVPQQIAQRLPRHIGLALLSEVAAAREAEPSAREGAAELARFFARVEA